MLEYLKNMALVMGIVFLRFRWLPRVWCVWLVAVNGASLAFLPAIEAQVVLLVTAVAVAMQAMIYGRIGFTRILGIVHLMWIPMFVWMVSRGEDIAAQPALAAWVLTLLATNLISMVIDAVDVTRFVRGERTPHYQW